MPKKRAKGKKAPAWSSAKKQPNWFMIAMIILLISGVIGVALIPTGSEEASGQTAAAVAEKIDTEWLAARRQYLSSRTEQSWWMSKLRHAPLKTDTQIEEAISQRKRGDQLVARCLARYRNVSTLSKRIADKFLRHESVIYAAGGYYYSYYDQDEGELLPEDDSGLIKIMYVPEEGFSRNFPAMLFYDQNNQMLVMAAIEWPTEDVFAAMLYHELGHALRHRVDKAPSATAPPNSVEYRLEEIEMHWLEAQILDKASGGDYFAYLDSIVFGHPEAKSASELIQTMRLKDYRKLDEIVGAKDASFHVAGILFPEHNLALGIRYIQKNPGKNQDKQYADLYRWVTTRR
jgi:hypothetical protein